MEKTGFSPEVACWLEKRKTPAAHPYQVFAPGVTLTTYENYPAAQQGAWETLRAAGAGALASIRSECTDGKFREIEYWTINARGELRAFPGALGGDYQAKRAQGGCT
jgi:hypothetical protein